LEKLTDITIEISDQEVENLHEALVEALKQVYDPEIPVDIYELGLIYKLEVSKFRHAFVQMTLTSPACPVAGTLPGEVERKVREVEGVQSAEVELVWDPPWDKDRMSEVAKLERGFL